MNQSLYSDIALKYITENHADFLKNIDFKEDQSFDCSIKSKKGKRFLWIATYNCELTIGFENEEGICDWHFHIGASGDRNQMEELKEMSRALDEILKNQKIFILEKDCYIPIEKEEYEVVKNKENIVFFNWSEI